MNKQFTNTGQDTDGSEPFEEHRPRLVRDRLQGKMTVVPSIITVAAFFCGFLAMFHAFNLRFEKAVGYIALAFILDGLDGRIARRLNATSAFGREMDSLSDSVAFGIAPAVLVYSWAFLQHADKFGVLVAFVFAVCGVMRLARFNVDTESRAHFQGLPIPGAAAALASLVYLHPQSFTNFYIITLLIGYTLLLAGLMVSSFTYFSIKQLKLKDQNPRVLLLVATIVVAAVWYSHREAIFAITTLYALSGLLGYLLRKLAPKILFHLQSIFGSG